MKLLKTTEDRVFERILLPIVKTACEKREAKASQGGTTESALGGEREYSVLRVCQKSLLTIWIGALSHNLERYGYECDNKYHQRKPSYKFSFVVQGNLPVEDRGVSEAEDHQQNGPHCPPFP
jgi:hypothetical protein